MTTTPKPTDSPTYFAQQPPRRSAALAVVALVLGVLAFVFSFIPVVNIVAFFLAVAGFVCGLISLIRKLGGKAMSILGVIFSVIAIVTAIVVNVAAVAVVSSASNEVSKSLATYSAQASAQHTIQYKVTTNGAATVSYWSPSGMSQAPVTSAWSKDVSSTGFSAATLSVTSSDFQDKGASVSCEIIIDGKSVATNTGSGAGAMASCNATTK